jgi:3-dehydroquinate dehydratase/shikimate dehydrogenase
MTLIAVPIFVDGPEDVEPGLERAADAVARGARLVEWRVDRLAGSADAAEAVVALARGAPAPCIVTARAPDEGGLGPADDLARAALIEAVTEAGGDPRYLDVELAAYAAHPDLRAAVDEAVASGDTALILSTHGLERRPADLLQRIEAMTNEPACAVIKVAWTARSLRDNLEAFDVLAERRKPTIALCMGEMGLMSRVLAPKFGGLLTFASCPPRDDVEAAEAWASAPGQPALETLCDRYRFDAIGAATRVYGVVGWPVAHSRGPEVHNAWFERAGHDGVYLPLPVPPEYEHFKATVGALVDHPRLDFAGASVTVPHKTHLLRFVEERGGRVDAAAKRIGAANTLTVTAGDGLACANTDAPAASAVLPAGMRRVAVLGAGGVARAVVAGLVADGAEVTVCGRTPARARALAEAFGAASATPEALATGGFDVFVNCTPLGMEGGPAPDASPLPDDVPLDDTVTVFDTVYTPERTPLIRDAEARGARVITGLDMFMRQAALQFETWTGAPPPT